MKRMLLVLLVACSKPPADTPPQSEPTKENSFAVPPSWTSQPPSNRLRKAQWVVPDKEKEAANAELVYSVLGLASGTIEQNLDRWAEQVGKGREDAKVEKDGAVTFVTFAGEPTMLVAAVEKGQEMHYFKLTGPAATVNDWTTEFRKLAVDAK